VKDLHTRASPGEVTAGKVRYRGRICKRVSEIQCQIAPQPT
jgi:hypothetical protein